jgi:hypothetical protein
MSSVTRRLRLLRSGRETAVEPHTQDRRESEVDHLASRAASPGGHCSEVDDGFGRGAPATKYLDRVATRSETLLEREMVADSKLRERRRLLGLEPRTNPMLQPMKDAADDPESTAAILRQIERGAKKDFTVTIPRLNNEVRVYRRARSDGRAAQRGMISAVVDDALLVEAHAKAVDHRRREKEERVAALYVQQHVQPSTAQLALGRGKTDHSADTLTRALSRQRESDIQALLCPPPIDVRGDTRLPPPNLPSSFAWKKCDLTRALEVAPADVEGAVGRDQWRVLVTERQELPPVDANTGRRTRRRVRHHRRSCKYHLFSTHRGFRQLSLQTTFPATAMRDSANLLVHAVHGASNGRSTTAVVDADWFVPMTIGWWEEMSPTQDSSPSRAELQDIRLSHRGPTDRDDAGTEAASPCSDAPLSVEATATTRGLPYPSGLVTSFALQAAGGAGGASVADATWTKPTAFLTETLASGIGAQDKGGIASRPLTSMSQRCKTPDVSRFETRARPHAEVEGEYFDCSCSDRSTDDELEVLSDAFKGEPAVGAASRLDCWTRGFAKVKVLTRSRLESRLQERRFERETVCNDRKHFGDLARDAESNGKEWRVNRQNRSSTPNRASVWHKHFTTLEQDVKRLNDALRLYVTVCDGCAKLNWPATSEDEVMALEIRQQFVDHMGLSADFVIGLINRRADAIFARSVTVKVVDFLRQQAGVPPKQVLGVVQGHVNRLHRQTAAIVAQAQHQAVHFLPPRLVAPEADLLLRRLQKAAAGGASVDAVSQRH